ncbi:hypothetical protein [Sedimenticola sp.]|uniref:hypothetical protein n=1 Tax=Sedimenticola sp. TaxID=1940285 RepID=UPI003D12131D
MRTRAQSKDYLLILALAGLLLFNFPLLSLFSGIGSLSGIPGLLIYFFGLWLAIILLTLLALKRQPQLPTPPPRRDDDDQ